MNQTLHWLPFPFFSYLEISGPDREVFLQGQLTADVKKITPEVRSWSAYCNTQGRMESFGLLENLGDRFHFYLPTQIAQHTLNQLKFFAKFSKVQITQGILPVFISSKLPSPDQIWIPVLSARGGDTTENNTQDASNIILTQMIQHQIPWLTPQTLKQFIPQELNLGRLGALSFEKGCYLGQEIIARLHYKGKLKTQMIAFEIPEKDFVDFSQTPGHFSKLICSVEHAGIRYILALQALSNT